MSEEIKLEIDSKNNQLVIRIPLTKGSPSSTGKMMLFGNSGGWKQSELIHPISKRPIKYLINVGYNSK